MEECEICGRKSENLYEVKIDSAILSVCARCANKKEETQANNQNKKRVVNQRFEVAKPKRGDLEDNEELVENYGKLIRDAREKMQIPIKVMAEMLNEKEAFLKRIEENRTLPPTGLVKRIEKLLSIRLFAEQ